MSFRVLCQWSFLPVLPLGAVLRIERDSQGFVYGNRFRGLTPYVFEVMERPITGGAEWVMMTVAGS